jgi:hypothetical protein
MVEAPGFATMQQWVQEPARMRVLLVKLLIGTTFDAFIDSAGFLPKCPEIHRI